MEEKEEEKEGEWRMKRGIREGESGSAFKRKCR